MWTICRTIILLIIHTSLIEQSVFCAPNVRFDNSNDAFLGDGKIININNPNQDEMREIAQFQVNLTALREQQEHLKSRYGMQNGQMAMDQTPISNNLEQLDSTKKDDPHLSARKT